MILSRHDSVGRFEDCRSRRQEALRNEKSPILNDQFSIPLVLSFASLGLCAFALTAALTPSPAAPAPQNRPSPPPSQNPHSGYPRTLPRAHNSPTGPVAR